MRQILSLGAAVVSKVLVLSVVLVQLQSLEYCVQWGNMRNGGAAVLTNQRSRLLAFQGPFLPIVAVERWRPLVSPEPREDLIIIGPLFTVYTRTWSAVECDTLHSTLWQLSQNHRTSNMAHSLWRSSRWASMIALFLFVACLISPAGMKCRCPIRGFG